MNTLIKKEIRLLLPAWLAAMALAALPFVFMGGAWGFDLTRRDAWSASFMATFVPVIFALGVLLLGISSFGQELSSGCFGVLLSQPAERRRIWLVKVATLAIAFISVWLTAMILASIAFKLCRYRDFEVWHPLMPGGRYLSVGSYEFEALANMTLAAFVTFSGGLWTTLLLRQISGAFWFTLLAPLAIIMGFSTVLSGWIEDDHSIDLLVAAALILYSIAGFFLARRLFLRAQDIQWGGGEVSLPWRGKFSSAKIIPLSSRPRHWLGALALKEIQLHQASLAIAVVLLALHLACLITGKIHPRFEGQDMKFVFQTYWALWLLMPLLVGTTAIAEERRIGVLESQLCAPVSRRAQFFIKFSVAFVLSLFLGVGMPWLIERWHTMDYRVLDFAAGIFFVAFYASSLARSILQAMGLAFVMAVAILLFEVPPWTLSENHTDGLQLLKHYLSLPVFVLLLFGLASWNFKWLHQNRWLWQRNLIAILIACASISALANSVYYRAWELFQPLDSRGPVRIHNATNVKFKSTWDRIYAISPNGRLWVEPFAYFNIPKSQQFTTWVLAPGSGHGQFIGGSNWVDVAANQFEALAIQSDGTLWAIDFEEPLYRGGNLAAAHARLIRIGADTNWSRVASGEDSFLLLKNDGSLWRWGTQGYDWKNARSIPQKIKKDSASVPVRVGDETDWTSLYSPGLLPHAKKSDGNSWMLAGDHLARETNVDNQVSELTTSPDLSQIGVTTNGELWYSNREKIPVTVKGHSVIQEQSWHFQLGPGMKWKAAMFSQFGTIQGFTAIRSDGTLWVIQVPWNGYYHPDAPRQLGHRSDWVTLALANPWLPGYALASDGSIWDWQPMSAYAWLAPSRRPLRVGNIFEGAETSQKP